MCSLCLNCFCQRGSMCWVNSVYCLNTLLKKKTQNSRSHDFVVLVPVLLLSPITSTATNSMVDLRGFDWAELNITPATPFWGAVWITKEHIWTMLWVYKRSKWSSISQRTWCCGKLSLLLADTHALVSWHEMIWHNTEAVTGNRHFVMCTLITLFDVAVVVGKVQWQRGKPPQKDSW